MQVGGQFGTAQLAAASLGASLVNVSGFSLVAGLAGGISTLCGQVRLCSAESSCGNRQDQIRAWLHRQARLSSASSSDAEQLHLQQHHSCYNILRQVLLQGVLSSKACTCRLMAPKS